MPDLKHLSKYGQAKQKEGLRTEQVFACRGPTHHSVLPVLCIQVYCKVDHSGIAQCAVVPVYIVFIAPPKHRRFLVSFHSLGITQLCRLQSHHECPWVQTSNTFLLIMLRKDKTWNLLQLPCWRISTSLWCVFFIRFFLISQDVAIPGLWPLGFLLCSPCNRSIYKVR